jgi:hypothetical protein
MIPPEEEAVTPPHQLCAFTEESPFLRVTTVLIGIKCTFDSLGLMFDDDPMYHRNIIADGKHLFYASQVDCQRLLQFHTVIQVDTASVFSVVEVLDQLRKCDIFVQPSVSLIIAPYRPDPKDQHVPPSKLCWPSCALFAM